MDDELALVPSTCPRCGTTSPRRFAGPCGACAAELREKYTPVARQVVAEAYEPAMHVTPNAVALKDD